MEGSTFSGNDVDIQGNLDVAGDSVLDGTLSSSQISITSDAGTNNDPSTLLSLVRTASGANAPMGLARASPRVRE